MTAFSPCAACGRLCCANYTVSIVGIDAWVIAKHLFLPFDSFLITFPVNDRNDSGFLLAPDGPPFEIALDKIGKYRKGNPCVFWMPLREALGRCGIYPYRPLVCQTYPAYQQGDIVTLRDDVFCPDRSWNLMGMDVVLFRRRLYRFRMERELYAYVVHCWNRAIEQNGEHRSLDLYYAYLMTLYDRIHEVSAAIPDERMGKIYKEWGSRGLNSPNPFFADLTEQTEIPEWRQLIKSVRDIVDRCFNAMTHRKRPHGRAAA